MLYFSGLNIIAAMMGTKKVRGIINPRYNQLEAEIYNYIRTYDSITTYLTRGTRNTIKLATLSSGQTLAIKSFKIPNVVNKYVYKFLRKPKAQRSYEHGFKLRELGFKTPEPIGYIEYFFGGTLCESYYISNYLEADISYRDLIEDLDYPDREEILKQFTTFSFCLHEKGIEFLDHSPGNTLIKKTAQNQYQFFLVDLNRMKFNSQLSFKERMRNLSRLTTNISDIEKIANQYARLIGKSSVEVFNRLWLETLKFQFRFYKKKEIKFRLKKACGEHNDR